MKLGNAIRRTYKSKGLTQAYIGDALGITQGEVSQMVTGKRLPSIDQMLSIEAALDVPAGYLMREAGIITDPVDVRSAVLADVHLSDEGREAVLAVYQAMSLSHSHQLANSR